MHLFFVFHFSETIFDRSFQRYEWMALLFYAIVKSIKPRVRVSPRKYQAPKQGLKDSLQIKGHYGLFRKLTLLLLTKNSRKFLTSSREASTRKGLEVLPQMKKKENY